MFILRYARFFILKRNICAYYHIDFYKKRSLSLYRFIIEKISTIEINQTFTFSYVYVATLPHFYS